MDSAVAGLRAHQNKLDVIGNNIANVNTYGFKSQTYSFTDAMYQTSSSSTGGTVKDGKGTIGGTNAAQYGYGALTGSIAMDMTSSTPSYVGGFNASINGSGFFITKSTADKIDLGAAVAADGSTDIQRSTAMKNVSFAYTRVGQFNIDSNGYMVDANGNFVYGYAPSEGTLADPTNYNTQVLVALKAPLVGKKGMDTVGGYDSDFQSSGTETQQLKSVTIADDGKITGTINVEGELQTVVLGKVAIANFQNQEGLTKAGNNTFNAKTGDNTGIATATVCGGSTSGLMSGYLEGSNVDLAKEFSDMITTQRGFQANSKIITVSDEVLQELVNMKR